MRYFLRRPPDHQPLLRDGKPGDVLTMFGAAPRWCRTRTQVEWCRVKYMFYIVHVIGMHIVIGIVCALPFSYCPIRGRVGMAEVQPRSAPSASHWAEIYQLRVRLRPSDILLWV